MIKNSCLLSSGGSWYFRKAGMWLDLSYG